MTEAMHDIDSTIRRLEEAYRSLTGREIPEMVASEALSLPQGVDPRQFVNEKIEDLLSRLESVPRQFARAWTPPASVWKGPKELLIVLDIPGVAKDTLDMLIEDQNLIVTGARQTPATNGHTGYEPAVCEHPLGPFRRTITLPSNFGEVSAMTKRGVLEISIPVSGPKSTQTQVQVKG